jgi:hypothetical protein
MTECQDRHPKVIVTIVQSMIGTSRSNSIRDNRKRQASSIEQFGYVKVASYRGEADRNVPQRLTAKDMHISFRNPDIFHRLDVWAQILSIAPHKRRMCEGTLSIIRNDNSFAVVS